MDEWYGGGCAIMFSTLGENAEEESAMDIGPTELIIILVIVLLIFGVGRLGKIRGELGSAIREFRQGLGGSETEQKPEAPREEKGRTL